MRIEEEARYQVSLGAHVVVQAPAQLVRCAVEGSVSNGAFLTYAMLFVVSDDDLARTPEEIALARGVSLRCFQKHLAQLEDTGWLDRDVTELDQANRPTRHALKLRFTQREKTEAVHE